jgi:hypothetical protein
MTSRLPSEELLKQEVREFTELLRHEDSSANIRGVLAANGLDASRTILAGLIDGKLSTNPILLHLPFKRFPLESLC